MSSGKLKLEPINVGRPIGFLFTGIAEPEIQDGGQAVICEIDSDHPDSGMFVRIQSWDETCTHTDIRKLIGKRVRITIETFD